MSVKRYSAGIPFKRANSIIALQRQNDIIAMLLDGKDSKEISKHLISRYSLTQGTANFYIDEARGIIKKRRKHETNSLVSLHLHRYEFLYKCLREIGAEHIAMKVLAAKEKLMGFHREGFHMKVTQGEITSVQLQSVDSDYDVKKLSPEKSERLTVLLNKAKGNGSGKSIRAV